MSRVKAKVGESRSGSRRVRNGRHPFYINREIFTVSLFQVEMNSKVFQGVYLSVTSLFKGTW